MKQDILIFSSHKLHLEQIYAAMSQQDISASIVFNSHEAMVLLLSRSPAFFWLDIDLEDAQIFLKEITDKVLHPLPYIILTTFFSDSMTRAVMLNQGADVCIETPVDLSEILAVLNAAWRREERLNELHSRNLLPCIEYKDLFIDPLRHAVEMRGQAVDLTRKEYELLYLLASNSGTAISRDQIYLRIWKTEGDIGRSVITDHISSLRKKLGLHAKDTDYIQTVFGVGYRFTKF